MKTSNQGKIALAVSEGIVDSAYLDSVGVWTIGIGHTASAGGINPKNYIGKKISMEEVMNLFTNDLPKYEDAVNRSVKVSLKQNEFDALVHFVYNIGETNFKKSNLLKNLNAGKKATAFQSGFHGWLQPPELKGRRDFERQIAQTGNYGSTIAPLYTANKAGKMSRTGTVDLKNVFKGETVTTTSPPVKDEAPEQTPVESTPDQKSGFLSLLMAFIALFTSKDK